MIHLAIDTHHNRVEVGTDGASAPMRSHSFTRRWEALMLAALLDAADATGALRADSLQALLRQRGQTKPLNRSQILRLVHNLQAFLDGLTDTGLRIETPPRKSTVGPWWLSDRSGLVYAVDGRSSTDLWAHPSLVADAGTDTLHAVLSTLLVADALAVEGRYAPATDVLLALDTQAMSAEGQGLVWLRLCSWYKHSGQFEAARAFARQVLALPNPADPGLARYAAFFLQRIDYDDSPAENWVRLWQSTQRPPGQGEPAIGDSDWRTLAEWHNLRALLARRRMQQLAVQPAPPGLPLESVSAEDTVASLSQLALRHFQAALYLVLWFRDWDRVQAYVANLAYHLQACLAQHPSLGVHATQVLNWHRLTMAYEDKLAAGRDSAWEYIFFGKFWLDNHEALQPLPRPDPLAHSLGNSSPDRPLFYQRALERLRECGDDRQIAIGHSLFIRFAQSHLPPEEGEGWVRSQTEQLKRLLEQQASQRLLQTLVDDGYSAHWPPALLALTGQVPPKQIQEIRN